MPSLEDLSNGKRYNPVTPFFHTGLPVASCDFPECKGGHHIGMEYAMSTCGWAEGASARPGGCATERKRNGCALQCSRNQKQKVK